MRERNNEQSHAAMEDSTNPLWLCRSCGGLGFVLASNPAVLAYYRSALGDLESADQIRFRCANCAAIVVLRPGQDVSVSVTGEDPAHVKEVASRLAAEAAAREAAGGVRASPWAAGSFYLTCMVTVIGLFLVVGKMLPVLVVPLILIAGVIATTIIGTFQLRHDHSLSEKGLLELMAMALRSLPRLVARTGHRHGSSGAPPTSNASS